METFGAAVFFVIGALFTIVFGRAFYVSLRSRNWIKAPGVIRATYMGKSTAPGEEHFHPSVRYSYEYAGQRYESNVIGPTSRSTQYPTEAKAMLAKYAVGQHVDVYVDPMNPHSAMLEAGVSGGALACTLLGIGFMIAALFIGYGF
jgi:hypothetical protein